MRSPMRWTAVAALATSWWLAACGGGGGGTRPDAADADGGIPADADGEQPDAGDLPGDTDAADADAGPVALRVTGVLPSRGPVQGGTWANVMGAGFVEGIGDSPFDVRDVTDVRFGDNQAVDIEVIRDDMISVRTPAGVAGTASVMVENPNGRYVLPEAFTYFETVTAYRVEPEDVSSLGGTAITVTGTGLTPDTTVLVGGRGASAVKVTDSTTVSARVPPAPPGAADVEVVNRNGRALVFRGVRYHPVPRPERIEPAAGPEAGGIPVAAIGAGLAADQQLFFGAETAGDVSFLPPDRLEASLPPGAGQVDVTVAGPVDSTALAGSFIYLPEPAGALAVLGVAPATGPAPGGPGVTVAGEGFSAGVDEVLFGEEAAADVAVLDDRTLQATLPPGAPGMVDVTVRTASGQASLPDAFRYFQPLTADGIEPASGPAEGGTPFTLTGSGFHQEIEVLFGGVPADALQVVSDTVVEGTAPPGPAGAVDVTVRDDDAQAVLEEGFSYTRELSLSRVEPDNGAMAGGTYVFVYGTGFGPEAAIRFGDRPGSVVQVLSSSVLTARAPRGEPGEVDVTVEQGGEQAVLAAGYSYFDPTNDRGGASGGPIAGTFNVTTLDGSYNSYGAPLPGATVMLEEPAISGVTDDRGQVTFSGPSLVRAVTATMAKEGYEAVTVVGLDAANLTVYLYPNEREPVTTTPIEITTSAIRGRVFGFKDIPGLPSGPEVSMQARVMRTSYSIYSVPPYGGVPQGQKIEQDGGRYEFDSLRLGNYSIYAWFGAYDAASDTFTPALLGLRRGIQLTSEQPATGQDIVLGTYLDQSVPVHLENPPLGDGETEPLYGAYVSLDLGADGVIFLAQDSGREADLLLERLPSAASDSFIFVGLASADGGYPFSYTFRRQQGEVGEGVTLGPFLGFTEIVAPEPGGELVDGRIAWTVDDPEPELIQILVETNELMPNVLWRVILPGDATEVTLPGELLDLLPQGEPMIMLMYTANSPRFTFDRFNFSQLGSSRWTSYTINYKIFTVP